MKRNVGGLDRAFRVGIGFPALSVMVATDDPLLKAVFGLVAAVGLVTWAIGYCPINAWLDRDTANKQE